MPLEEELILAYLKIINFLLNLNIKIGKRLAFYQAKYSAGEEVEQIAQRQKFDLRGMANRFKAVMLHDQDIIDKRMEICNGCEFLFKPTGSCKKCGCFVSKKTRVATVACPIGKWDKEYDFMEGKATNGTRTTAEL